MIFMSALTKLSTILMCTRSVLIINLMFVECENVHAFMLMTLRYGTLPMARHTT